MANINDKRNFLRQELLKHADQVAALRSKAAINDVNALAEIAQHAAGIQQNASALLHLLDVEPEKIIEKVVEKVVVEVPVKTSEPVVEKTIVPPVAELKQPVPEMKQAVPEVKPAIPASSDKKLPELKSMIGLNEKLMFIKTLFGGDSNLYDIEIAKLNACHDKLEMEALLDGMAIQRHWKKDSEAFLSLQSILKRRMA